jgi:hypothetical protein
MAGAVPVEHPFSAGKAAPTLPVQAGMVGRVRVEDSESRGKQLFLPVPRFEPHGRPPDWKLAHGTPKIWVFKPVSTFFPKISFTICE